jgi:predicted anti-sigma-YlaC factor YlaD
VAVQCEQIRRELAVLALTGDRHGGLDAASTEHLDGCADCTAEQRRLADVTRMLSRVGLGDFEGTTAPETRAVERGTAES